MGGVLAGKTVVMTGAGRGIGRKPISAFRPSFARADEVSAHVFPYDPI